MDKPTTIYRAQDDEAFTIGLDRAFYTESKRADRKDELELWGRIGGESQRVFTTLALVEKLVAVGAIEVRGKSDDGRPKYHVPEGVVVTLERRRGTGWLVSLQTELGTLPAKAVQEDVEPGLETGYGVRRESARDYFAARSRTLEACLRIAELRTGFTRAPSAKVATLVDVALYRGRLQAVTTIGLDLFRQACADGQSWAEAFAEGDFK